MSKHLEPIRESVEECRLSPKKLNEFYEVSLRPESKGFNGEKLFKSDVVTRFEISVLGVNLEVIALFNFNQDEFAIVDRPSRVAINVTG